MKLSHIPTLPVEQNATIEKTRMRTQAPRYIQSVIEETRAIPVFKSLSEVHSESISVLSGGVSAATYLLQSSEMKAVLKFNYQGVEAEVEALKAWRQRHAHVPRVYASGVVPVTKQGKKPVKYLLQQALIDKNGRVVETCADFLMHAPTKSREVGRLMGIELNKMHGCTARRHFGDYADSPNSLATYASWNGYMRDFLKTRAAYLQSLGISERQLKLVDEFIAACRFVKRGRYIHGDFSVRNAAITAYEPLQVYLFDPNPMIGDPSWDIANFYNNYEFKKRRLQYDRSIYDAFVREQQLLIGFRQGYTRRVPQESLMVARLIQASLQAEFQESMLAQGKGEKIAVRVRQELIKDLVDQIVRHAQRAN